jgi:long-chain acyl-CoA synthetase
MTAVARDATAPATLNAVFFATARSFDRADAALAYREGRWQPVGRRELTDRVRRIALGLGAVGIRPGDRVAIISENRPEWAMADWACLTSGVTDVPIYPTLPAEQIPYLLNDSGAVAIFTSTPEQTEKIATVRKRAPALRTVISFDDAARRHADLTLAELEEKGRALDSPARAAEWERQALAIPATEAATVIYTSGTTGEPKGVVLTHANFHFELEALRDVLPVDSNDVALSFLPLSHVFQRVADYYLAARGTAIAYVESIDRVAAALQEVRPTIACSVPRLYEKMYARVLDAALGGSPIRKQIFYWARRVADRWATEVLAGRRPAGLLALRYAVAQRLVFGRLKARTGGRLRFFVSGGAPLTPEINRFFYAAGLTILEGYGLTETTAVISVNTPQAFRIGTVGRPISGVEVRIADDGEILTRGPHVMREYLNKPEATREAIDPDGWLHTGDIGVIEDGFIRITDRKKDLIVTAGGKKIAPQPIENLARTNKYVSQAVMIGDRRKYPVLLVVPNFEHLEKWAKQRNIIWTDRSQLLAMPTVHEKMEREVRETLLGLASFETPKKIGLLGRDFTLERGELTPTLKVKRRVIETAYKLMIDTLYESSEQRAVSAMR